MGSLEKSHSKVSNFKLTMICILLTICASAIWLGVSLLLNMDNKTLGSIILASGGVGTLLFMFLIGRFTR